MKKLFVLTMLLVSLLAPSTYTFADDGDDDGDVINIEYIGSGQSHSRSQVEIPIRASFFSSQSVVGIVFLDYLGTVSVRMTNLSVGNSSVFVVDSSWGSCILPVSFGPGSYSIEFLTVDGSRFQGFFTVF